MRTITIVFSVIGFLLLSCKNQATKQNEIETYEEVISGTYNEMIEDCWNLKDFEKLRNITSENFVRNVNGITVARNRNEMEAAMNVYFTGFPDLQIRLSNTVKKENRIFTQWTTSGTNTGVFGEVPATGKKASFSGYTVGYFNDEGILTQQDVYYNDLELLQQLGYSLNPPIVE